MMTTAAPIARNKPMANSHFVRLVPIRIWVTFERSTRTANVAIRLCALFSSAILRLHAVEYVVRFKDRKAGGLRGCGRRRHGVDEVGELQRRDVGFWMLDVGRF